MFEQLQERLTHTFRVLRGQGQIRDDNIAQALCDIKSSLLEADVSYRVTQSFVDSVRQKAVGQEIPAGVDAGQLFCKFVFDELVSTLGSETPALPKGSLEKPIRILFMGLQGSGKTTTVAKVAKFLRDEQGEHPLLVPLDTARPAAREQLEQLGRDNGLAVFSSRESSPIEIVRLAERAVHRREISATCLLFDTAGRLHVDENLMTELKALRDEIHPDRSLYVVDAMAGQDGVTSAQLFSEKIGFEGLVVTKMDGDARGGVALSLRRVTGKPVYFLGTGEKMEALERLHPDRMASRILGMGDVISLVEKAQQWVDQKESEKLARKIRKNQFTIEDFGDQLRNLKKMGSLEQILDLLPGGGAMKKALAGGMPENEIRRTVAMIDSMTLEERRNYQVLNGGRRQRIAKGSGTTVADVNRFLKQFLQTKKMMSMVSQGAGARGLQDFMRGRGFPQ